MSSVEEKIGKSFLIRAIEWGLDHPQGFSVSEVTEALELSLSNEEKDILKTYLLTAHRNHYSISVVGSGPVNPDTLFLALYTHNNNNYEDGKNKYVISLESQFNFIDYQELKFAQENAKEARRLSLLAIWISAFALFTPVIIAIFFTQEVKIDTWQFTKLTKAIESTKVSSEQVRDILETLVQVKK